MSKSVSPALQAHLNDGSTTMVYCWRIERLDGVIEGYTEHDRNLEFDGTIYEASSGFTASRFVSELGLSVDNLSAEGAISSDSLTARDLAAGVYDAANIELYWVNFNDVSQRQIILKGTIGEVKRGETSFTAEMRSLSHLMQQKTGRTYRRYCDAALGDSRCGVNLALFTETSAVGNVQDSRFVSDDGSLAASAGTYTYGKITFTSGNLDGLSFAVKEHTVSGGISRLTLWEPLPYEAVAADTFEVSAGCAKDFGTCRDKFSNGARFQGFPYIPGNDALLQTGQPGGPNQDGGSRNG